MAKSQRTIAISEAALAAWIHRHLLWLLIGCYALAAYVPGPGLVVRRISVGGQAGEDEVTIPLMLLALLLFCAAVVVRWSRVRELLRSPGVLVAGVLAVWIVPGLFVSAVGLVAPWLLGSDATAGMMVGLALVAAMPVANSSAAWCQNARGNVALGLGLIIVSIVCSPIAAPQMLNFMGLALSAEETAQCEQLVTKFSGTFFIVWVILPSALGMLVNWLVGMDRIERVRPWIRLVSALDLLLLNYTNASLAMPEIASHADVNTVLIPAVLTVAMCVIGVAVAWVMARSAKLAHDTHVALVFGLSMKHTGLALVLAADVLAEEERVLLTIMLATLLQHVVAAGADWYLEHYGRREPQE